MCVPVLAAESMAMTRAEAVRQFKARVLAVVAAIPEGRVTTYGTIARHVHVTARQVAFVLANLTAAESRRLPWFRVVGAGGVVSSTKRGSVGRRQIARLRAEGVAVTARHKVEDFSMLAWSPAEGLLGELGTDRNARTGSPRHRSVAQ